MGLFLFRPAREEFVSCPHRQITRPRGSSTYNQRVMMWWWSWSWCGPKRNEQLTERAWLGRKVSSYRRRSFRRFPEAWQLKRKSCRIQNTDRKLCQYFTRLGTVWVKSLRWQSLAIGIIREWHCLLVSYNTEIWFINCVNPSLHSLLSLEFKGCISEEKTKHDWPWLVVVPLGVQIQVKEALKLINGLAIITGQC